MVNKVILLGRVSQDIETKFTTDGTAITTFSMATNESYKNKAGEKVEKVEFHKVVAFGRLGEIIAEYLSKGSQLYIEGKLQTDKWQDKDGNNRWTTKIIAREMKMLGNKQGGQAKQTAKDEEPDIDDVPF